MRTKLLGLAALGSLVAAAPPSGQEWTQPQQLIGVEGERRIHIRCLGQGSPAVVLTAGLGESIETWRKVMPGLAKTTRVCAWDRAGMGFSDPTTLPQDVAHTTADLERALTGAGIRPPYVMVGHSLGSFESLLFTYRHGTSVAGMVLVDPASPHQTRAFSEASAKFGALTQQRQAQRISDQRKCLAALQGGQERAPACGTPSLGRTLAQRIGILHSIISLGENMDRSSAQLTAERKPLGALPLIVLTAGKAMSLPDELAPEQPKVSATWRQMHQILAAQSTIGVTRLVEGSGHYVHVDQPSAVVSSVREVIAQARAR